MASGKHSSGSGSDAGAPGVTGASGDGAPLAADPVTDLGALRDVVSDRVSSIDPRAHAAWRTWLGALARDADAVTAAALAYESLGPDGRDAWLDALDADAPHVDVPKIALYAPLLGVEYDDQRRARIASNVEGAARRSVRSEALVGERDGERVCLIVTPLYLDFVELLVCVYEPDRGVHEARHRWLAHASDVSSYAEELGVELEGAPLPQVVEELAHAVVADRRAGRDAPSALMRCSELFAPDVDALADDALGSGRDRDG